MGLGPRMGGMAFAKPCIRREDPKYGQRNKGDSLACQWDRDFGAEGRSIVGNKVRGRVTCFTGDEDRQNGCRAIHGSQGYRICGQRNHRYTGMDGFRWDDTSESYGASVRKAGQQLTEGRVVRYG